MEEVRAFRNGNAVLQTVLILLCLSALGYGQSIWIGGSGNFSNATDWCPKGVPNGVDVSIGACLQPPPSNVTDDVFATVNNLSIDAGNSITVSPGVRLTINGSSIANSGTILLAGTASQNAQVQLAATPTVTLSGGGTFAMSDAANLVLGGGTSTTLVNMETITGAGTLGAEGFFSLNNQGLIDAEGKNPLNIYSNFGTALNTGTLQASKGGTLQLTFNGGSTPGLNNAGGTIQALDKSIVRLQNPAYISGGTLKTAGSGFIHGVDGGLKDLTNAGLFQVGGISGFGSAVIHLGGTITNTGTIQIGTAAWGDDGTEIDGTTTLTGKGTVNFGNPIETMSGGTLVNNDNTISGTGTIASATGLTNSGTVNANSPAGPLVLALSMTNTGTMEASGGGELRTEGDITNTGGTIAALDGSKVTLVSNTITGGTLATSGSGVIQTAPTQPVLSGVTNTGLVSVAAGDQIALKGTITNSGTISLDAPGNAIISGAVTTKGKGTVLLSNNSQNFVTGGGSSPSWTNVDNLIEGGGTFDANFAFTNQKKGVVSANVATPLVATGGSVSNLGTFKVSVGSVLGIPSGVNFTNFSGGTLTGGIYEVAGTFSFFNSGNITANAANVQLTSPSAQIIDSSSGKNSLLNLASNTAKGSITISGGQELTTNVAFSNSGNVTVAKSSKLTVGGTYTQTAGTTQVDGKKALSSAGTVTATAFTLSGGVLQGNGGLINAPVTSSATVIAGDSKTKVGILNVGSYTQNASGTLEVQVKGTTSSTCAVKGSGTTFSLLNSANGIVVNGGTLQVNVLAVTLHSGDCYVIATGSALSGGFTNVVPAGTFTVNFNKNVSPQQVQLVVD